MRYWASYDGKDCSHFTVISRIHFVNDFKSYDFANFDNFVQTTEEGDGEELLCFNVGGKKFFVLRRCLDRLPDSRLGLLVNIIIIMRSSFIFHDK